AFAERAGAERLATGHYARVVERRGRRLLARALDDRKDQSYMLAGLDPHELGRVWFPLGEQTKEETRAEAERAGLQVARRPESQEACFLGGGDYRNFLLRHGVSAESGDIVDEEGVAHGRHDGFCRYTPAQRRGPGIASATGAPLYALRAEQRSNTVVVGPRESLARTSVSAAGRLHVPVRRAEAKLRYRSPAIPTRVEATADGFRLVLETPAYGVAPGQGAGLYDHGPVGGPGKI